MAELIVSAGRLATVFLIAVALGMDAFSLCLGIGMKGIRLLHVAKISAAVAFFHMMMPLIGVFTGKYVSMLLGEVASLAGGGLLVLLGGHMIYSSLSGEDVKSIDTGSLFGLLAFALSVSVDSLSVGVSLGMLSTDLIVTVVMFGCIGGIMSVAGMLIGRRVGKLAGDYGEMLGGAVLLVFGIFFLI